MSGENPYAPPETTSVGLPDAPESFGWELVGKAVWVEKFAQFPMVDPYTGQSDDVMTMNRLTVRVRPLWMSLLQWAFIGILLLGISPLAGGIATLVGLLGLIVLAIVSALYPLTGLKVFFVARTLRNRAIQYWIFKGCLMLAILSGLTLGIQRLFPKWLSPEWIFMIALGIWLIGLIWQHTIERRLTCRRHKDGRFEIRGFHPKALEFLAQEKQTRASAGTKSD